jgi:hypothetical protein
MLDWAIVKTNTSDRTQNYRPVVGAIAIDGIDRHMDFLDYVATGSMSFTALRNGTFTYFIRHDHGHITNREARDGTYGRRIEVGDCNYRVLQLLANLMPMSLRPMPIIVANSNHSRKFDLEHSCPPGTDEPATGHP